jgi:hypothetical protein
VQDHSLADMEFISNWKNTFLVAPFVPQACFMGFKSSIIRQFFEIWKRYFLSFLFSSHDLASGNSGFFRLLFLNFLIRDRISMALSFVLNNMRLEMLSSNLRPMIIPLVKKSLLFQDLP